MEEKKVVKARLGIDLGTTNSAVCYLLEEDQNPKFFWFDNHTRSFFPTLVAYNRKDGSCKIGAQARKFRYNKNYDAYDTFKLSLGEKARDKGGRDKAPIQVAKDFIAEVLRKFADIHGIKKEDLTLVQTVPDVWKHEIGNCTALENLSGVYEQLGMETDWQVAFESEPVSAAAYYLKEVCKGEYAGHVIVVDYGGGTLDLTLCRVNENGVIEVLWSCGDGGKGMSGCAGYAFDRAAVMSLVERCELDQDDYAPGKPAFGKLAASFEDSKIASVQETEDAMKAYYESEGIYDSKVFTVIDPSDDNEYEVLASDIDMAYQKVNQEALKQAIEQMKDRCEVEKIDVTDIEKMRVLLVGGFSNLFCVERTVRESFGSRMGNRDPRFDNGISREKRSEAIAHGACLIAAGITPVVHINQNEMGFFGLNIDGEVVAVPVIERGKAIKEYLEPRYSPYLVKQTFHGLPVNLELYFDDGYGKIKMPMREEFFSICPNSKKKENTYKIGFSIDRHRIPQLHVRDGSGAETVTSLYQLITRLPAVRIQGGEKEA